MLFFLTHWKALSAALAGVLLAGYVGLLNVQVASAEAALVQERAQMAVVQGRLDHCGARLTNILERIESDATVPDDLDGFVIPDHWLLNPTP